MHMAAIARGYLHDPGNHYPPRQKHHPSELPGGALG